MTKIIDICEGFVPEHVDAAADILRRGGLIVSPTDTLYAVVGDAFSARAVERIYALKKRRRDLPLPLIAASLEQVGDFLFVNDAAKMLAARFWPGALTLVLNARKNMPAHLPAKDGTVAVRTPDHDFCRALARKIGRPITATSTNLSGEAPARRIDEIPPEIMEAVDLVIDQGESKVDLPSTIVRFKGGHLEILREGSLKREDLIESTGKR